MPIWTLAALGAAAIFAGANLAFQAVLNAQLRGYLGSPVRATFVSYAVGTLVCVIYALVTRESLEIFPAASRSHWWLWTGGLYGVVYVVIIIWLIPRLGSAPVFALVIAGQMLAALAFDHVGLFGTAARPIDGEKLAGVALLVAGAVLIRR